MSNKIFCLFFILFSCHRPDLEILKTFETRFDTITCKYWDKNERMTNIVLRNNTNDTVYFSSAFDHNLRIESSIIYYATGYPQTTIPDWGPRSYVTKCKPKSIDTLHICLGTSDKIDTIDFRIDYKRKCKEKAIWVKSIRKELN